MAAVSDATILAAGDCVTSGAVTPGYVKLMIRSDSMPTPVQRTFALTHSLGELKNRLELVSGVSVGGMRLQLEDENGTILRTFADNSQDLQPLSSLDIPNGVVVRIIEPNVTASARQSGGNEFDDVSQVEKYEISEDSYAKRQNSLMAFKKERRLGRFDASRQQAVAEDAVQREEQERERLTNMHVGDRCQVNLTQAQIKRGKIMYIGEADFKPGVWVGIQYDEPVGKNDGSVAGKRYFQCAANYGGFVRPSGVEVGDFPEVDIDAEMGEI